MTGQVYKGIILKSGKNLSQIAKIFEIGAQTLDRATNSKDINSSYIDRAISLLGISILDFYPQEQVGNVDNIVTEDTTIVTHLLEENKMLLEQNHMLTKIIAGFNND